MMDEAINGIDGTVPVTSRSAYNFPSAGARSPDCPARTNPSSPSFCRNSSRVRFTRKPGIDSILSRVPPLNPNPRPDIFPTGSPQAATSGSTTNVVLSPTPPVECLSTAKGTTPERSSISPDRAIAIVRSVVSRSVIPFNRTAIAQAAA